MTIPMMVIITHVMIQKRFAFAPSDATTRASFGALFSDSSRSCWPPCAGSKKRAADATRSTQSNEIGALTCTFYTVDLLFSDFTRSRYGLGPRGLDRTMVLNVNVFFKLFYIALSTW